jgi:hypothetical protein
MDSAPMASIEQFPQKQGIKAAEILFKIIDDRISEASLTPVFHHAVFDSSMVSHRGRTNV